MSKLIPGDEVLDYLSIDDRGYHAGMDPVEERRSYARVASLRGLDLPSFYFSVIPGYLHDSMRYILPQQDRQNVEHWAKTSRNGELSFKLYKTLRNGLTEHCRTDHPLCRFYDQFLSISSVGQLKDHAIAVRNSFSRDTTLPAASVISLSEVVNLSTDLSDSSFREPASIARFIWNGTKNQYHKWMTGLLYQQPLTSLVDGRNAWAKVYDALKWTLVLNGFAFIISIALGFFIGIWSGKNDGEPFEKIINWILFALFTIPSFWLATLFIYFFSSGEWFSIFPSGGLGDYHDAGSVLGIVSVLAVHLFLPVMCLALGALAFVSRQMKQSVQHEYYQPYVSMLRAQGISEKTILRKHVIRNSLFPLITMMGGSIPALLSGSLIIEVIFSIPGMGRLMYSSILSRDWPVVFPVLMLVAFVTISSYVLVDIIYKWADPRIKVLSRS